MNVINAEAKQPIETGLVSQVLSALALPSAICVAGVALFWSLPAHAQSFECASAQRPAEFAICNSEDLMFKDEQLEAAMSKNFVNASTAPQRQQVVREHDAWVKLRNACGNDVTCLNLRYDDRLTVLRSRDS